MPTLPNTGVITPTPGGDAGTWDDKINAAWANYDDHRHESGNGLRIRTAGIDINADLTFNSLYAPINLHRLTFASIVALTGNNKSLFVSDADNELYWRSNTGTNVKLTLGNALNVAAFTGGFGAGYSSAGAAADYDDSTEQYTFKQAPAGAWSRGGFGGIRLYEFGTTETTRLGLLAASAMASSYDVTFPAAPTEGFLLMGGTGALESTDAVPFDVTFDNGITVTDVINASGGVTCAVNQHLTVSGTGELKHGDRVMSLHACSGYPQSAWNANATIGSMDSVATGRLIVPIPLLVGDRIKSLTFLVFGNASATLNTSVISLDGSMVGTSIGSDGRTPAASWLAVTIDVTDTTIGANGSIYIDYSATNSGIRVGSILVTYDRP